MSSLKNLNLSPKWKNKKIKPDPLKSSIYSLSLLNKKKKIPEKIKIESKLSNRKSIKLKSNKIKILKKKIKKKEIKKKEIKKKIFNLPQKKLSQGEKNIQSQNLLDNYFKKNKERKKNQEVIYNKKKDIDEYNYYYHHRNVKSLTKFDKPIINYKLDIESLFNDNHYS